jgi:hypothetical protein
MVITNLWEKLTQPSQSLETFKKDVAEGKVPELPYYIVGQSDLKAKIAERISEIDSQRMTTNMIVASYGNGKTNLLKYLQLFFNAVHREHNISVNYSRADVERTDIILFLLKIVQDNHLDLIIQAVKEIRRDAAIIPTLVNNFQNNFAEIKDYTVKLFDVNNSDEALLEILYLGTGRLYNKRYFDKHHIEQLKDFNRREILVLFLNLISYKGQYIIFAIDEIEKIREKSGIRFNHFLTSYRELVDLFNQIKGHLLIVAMTDSIGSSVINEANNALYTRIKNDIVPIEVISKKDDVIALISYLNELFGKSEDAQEIYSQLRKGDKSSNRILIQEISKYLHREVVDKPLTELLEESGLKALYDTTKEKLNKDEAFKNLHRKFFDPLEYYVESIGIDSNGLNKQERVLIDEAVEKVHYFIFNSYLEDFANEKNKINRLLVENPDKQVIVYAPETLGLTNSLINDDDDTRIKIIDYVPEELFVLLEMYRENFDVQSILNGIISLYTNRKL